MTDCFLSKYLTGYPLEPFWNDLKVDFVRYDWLDYGYQEPEKFLTRYDLNIIIDSLLCYCPHSMATCTGCVTHDQRVLGSPPVLAASMWICMYIIIYQWCAKFLWFHVPKIPLGVFQKENGIVSAPPPPPPGFCHQYVHGTDAIKIKRHLTLTNQPCCII